MGNDLIKATETKALAEVVKADSQLKFLSDLVSLAVKLIDPVQIVLFGSRARGDHTKTSDVDLAFVVPDTKKENWPLFVAEADESLKTLLKLDLLRMDRAPADLTRSIAKEGVVLYG